MAFEGRRSLVDMGRLGREDAQVGIPELGRIRCRLELGREVVAAGDAEAVLLECLRVLLAPRQDDDVRYLREMRRVQAADRPGADDADARAATSVQP